jgi:hypothetical protein
MELEESIVQLGTKLDAWWDGFSPMLASEDRAAQVRALLSGFAWAKEYNDLKAKGLATIRAFVERHDTTTEDQHVACLIGGFAFAAKLSATLHDEFQDMDAVTEVAHLMRKIAVTLDGTLSGRAALAVLLDDADARVRAYAGAYLLMVNLLPERVVPILRDIAQKERANDAHFTAYWAVLRWEREGSGAVTHDSPDAVRSSRY